MAYFPHNFILQYPQLSKKTKMYIWSGVMTDPPDSLPGSKVKCLDTGSWGRQVGGRVWKKVFQKLGRRSNLLSRQEWISLDSKDRKPVTKIKSAIYNDLEYFYLVGPCMNHNAADLQTDEVIYSNQRHLVGSLLSS